jgi:hypothetical protein
MILGSDSMVPSLNPGSQATIHDPVPLVPHFARLNFNELCVYPADEPVKNLNLLFARFFRGDMSL